MSTTTLADRGKTLEDAFFAKQDAALRRRLAELDHTTATAAALAEASGITDPALLERLVALGLSAATLSAMTLVPLVVMAWADGSVEAPERDLVMAGAAKAGVGETHPGHALLEGWLKTRPRPDLLAAWKATMTALPAETRAALAADLLDGARRVAEATGGGILGLGRKVSAAERAVLDDLRATLSA